MNKIKTKQRYIFISYWLLVVYVLLAFIWWYIMLEKQNEELFYSKLSLVKNLPNQSALVAELQASKNRKSNQYIGEGFVFLGILVAAAIIIYQFLRSRLYFYYQQDNFISSISHELKTPLSVLLLNLQTLQKKSLPQEKQQHILNNSIIEIQRLNTLFDSILHINALENNTYQIERKTYLIEPIIKEASQIAMLKYASRTIAININNSDYINVDKPLFMIALINLINNAFEYSEEKSVVKIIVYKNINDITIDIIDEGIGIKQNEITFIFNKFYRSQKAMELRNKGTGIGLYLTKQILLLHNMQIGVIANKPQGSIFRIIQKNG